MNTEDDATTPSNKPTIATVTPGEPTLPPAIKYDTPPQLRAEIADITGFTFAPDLAVSRTSTDTYAEDTVTATEYIMFSPRSAAELPSLRTEKWPYSGRTPNPISISKARKLLAAAYAAVPCEIEGTGVHGYAWMVESTTDWQLRRGVTATITPPVKPPKERDYDVKKQMAYADNMEAYKLYHHLVQEGQVRLIEWFGKSMFVDMYENEMLPATTTPTDLLGHLTATYSQGRDNRRYMEQVEQSFNSPYDQKQPVEVYFMKLQEARANAELLHQPFTEQQTMNKALAQFEQYLGKDAFKAEKRWNDKPTDEHNWPAFKAFWKEEIHQWETVNKSSKQANQVVSEQMHDLTKRFDSMQMDMSALQAENHSVHEQNNALMARQAHIHEALKAEQRRGGGDDTSIISSITDHMTSMERRLATGLNAHQSFSNHTGSTQTTADSSKPSPQHLLQTAKQRAPDAYKHLNSGRGKLFGRYCWLCGCNCTHSTRGCYELNDDQKQRYKDATFTNTMNGSTKFLDRRDRYQKDFNFDSL